MAARYLGRWDWAREIEQLRVEHLSKKQLREGWAEFLGRWEWDWFCTLTFRGTAVHPETAAKKSRLWLSKINRELFGSRWWKKNRGVFWVRALEMQKRNVLHYHMLLRGAGLKNLRRLYWMDEWNKIAGYARIEKPRETEAVRRYCAKYVAKGGEIDLGGPREYPLPSLFDVQSGSGNS